MWRKELIFFSQFFFLPPHTSPHEVRVFLRILLPIHELNLILLQIAIMAQLPKKDQPIRLWGGRFTGATDPLMDQYNESLSIDRVFYAQDIKGSIAYARANVKTGILTQEEFEIIERGLREVLQEWEEGKFTPAPGDEGKQAPIHIHLYFPLGPSPDTSQVASR